MSANIEFSVPRSYIRACLVTVAKNDIRYYLNGMNFEAYPDRVFMVGCDA